MPLRAVLYCEYEELVNRILLADLFIFGLHLQSIQSVFLKEGKDLTIENALQIKHTEEATHQHMEILHSTRDETQINDLKKTGKDHHAKEYPPYHTHMHHNGSTNTQRCGNCGHQHQKGAYPEKA